MIKTILLAGHLLMSNDNSKMKIDSAYFQTDSSLEAPQSIVVFPIDDYSVVSGLANVGATWQNNVVPLPSQNVRISSGTTVQNGAVFQIKNLEINGTLNLGVGQTLKIGF
jgi:hypothetical protein